MNPVRLVGAAHHDIFHAVRVVPVIHQEVGDAWDQQLLVSDAQAQHGAGGHQHGPDHALSAHPGGQERHQLVMPLHPGHGEGSGHERDHLAQSIEILRDHEAVVRTDVFQNGGQTGVVLGKIVDVREQVDHDVQAKDADQTEEVGSKITANQQAIKQCHSENPNSMSGLLKTGTLLQC